MKSHSLRELLGFLEAKDLYGFLSVEIFCFFTALRDMLFIKNLKAVVG